MRYTCVVDIDLPLETVIEKFDNPDNLKEWQDGFVSFERISGTPGEPGAKSRIRYKIGKKEIELIETVTVRNLPYEFSGTYDASMMSNTLKNTFTELDAGKTRLTCEIEYTKLNGIMPKVVAALIPGVYKKQTQKWLDQFKAFAERKGDS